MGLYVVLTLTKIRVHWSAHKSISTSQSANCKSLEPENLTLDNTKIQLSQHSYYPQDYGTLVSITNNIQDLAQKCVPLLFTTQWHVSVHVTQTTQKVQLLFLNPGPQLAAAVSLL